ncbi:MAG: two-component system, chemotaxis family, protein-glutamate methylesterase/glutaminase [Frankiales bacterium]|nr:two-component system, chemotaxis family, protein-glutamate methylesterase/glutaminase [Frankiales bacterium]
MIGSTVPSTPSAVGLGVVVVDDSPVQRRFLRAMIDADPELTVIGEARTGKEAVALVERLHPVVVLMDLDLPVMNGIEAIERIMAIQPTPIVVYSAFVAGPDNANGLAALAAGAVDIVAKPSPRESEDLDAYAESLRRRLRVASRVRVITHVRGRLKSTALSGAALPAAPVEEPVAVQRAPATRAAEPAANRPPRAVPAEPGQQQIDLIAIGVSTGGPQALASLLSALPETLTQAVLIVQHMADGFLEGLAQWLDSQCALPVGVGEGGKRLQPGTVTLAPGGLNLIIHERLRVTCEVPPPSQFHIPGIDPTFRSIAHHVGPAAIGVILTGMGRDGAAGLKEMRDCGAITVGQDEASSAVYGMPGAAKALGAIEHERPLSEIASLLLSLVQAPVWRVTR